MNKNTPRFWIQLDGECRMVFELKVSCGCGRWIWSWYDMLICDLDMWICDLDIWFMDLGVWSKGYGIELKILTHCSFQSAFSAPLWSTLSTSIVLSISLALSALHVSPAGSNFIKTTQYRQTKERGVKKQIKIIMVRTKIN